MDNILLSLGSGVISGLIAAFLALVARQYWISIVMPWYEERIYKDAKIEGLWRSRVEYTKSENDWDEFIIDIRRQSHSVIATLTCIDGANRGSTYKLEWLFRNLILTGTYSSTDEARLARGTLTLMLVNSGDLMEGLASVYSPIDHAVFHSHIRVERGSVAAKVL